MKRIILIGPIGCGKTTLRQKVTRKLRLLNTFMI